MQFFGSRPSGHPSEVVQRFAARNCIYSLCVSLFTLCFFIHFVSLYHLSFPQLDPLYLVYKNSLDQRNQAIGSSTSFCNPNIELYPVSLPPSQSPVPLIPHLLAHPFFDSHLKNSTHYFILNDGWHQKIYKNAQSDVHLTR